MPVTQQEIAKKVGLSRQAVRFALSTDLAMQRQIRPETRERILSAVEQMGYVPHFAARRLARAQGGQPRAGFDQVGLIFRLPRDIEVDAACLTMMGAVEHEISHFNAMLTFVRVRQREDWLKIQRLISADSVDGWMLYGAIDDDAIDRMDAAQAPYVILGDHRCTRPVHCVTIDNAAGGRLAVERLAALGHRRIGFLGGSMQYVYQHRTLQGYRAAVKELGLDDDPELIADHTLWTRAVTMERVMETNQKLVIQWLRRARPTALFCTEINWASEMYRVLRAARIAVPRDISLVACYAGPGASTDDTFTHITLPLTEVGHRGALLLHGLVSDPRIPRDTVNVLPTFVAGWSTEKPQRTNRAKF